MGFLKHLILGDWGQSADIVENSKQLQSIHQQKYKQSSELAGLRVELSKLKSQVQTQNLAITALSRFLIEKELISEEELAEFIDAVDQEDGTKDGKLTYSEGKELRLNLDRVRKATEMRFPKST